MSRLASLLIAEIEEYLSFYAISRDEVICPTMAELSIAAALRRYSITGPIFS